MQTMRECALLQQFGNDARVITLDPNFPSGWISESHYNISRKDSILKREMQMLLADKKIENSVALYFTYFTLLGLNNYGNRTIASVQSNVEKRSQAFTEMYAICPFMIGETKLG